MSPIARRAQPPPPDGKTDVLLRFFDSEFFDEWIAVSYLWRATNEEVINYLCNRMYTLSDDRIERYLSQIIVLQILRPNPSLERTIIDFCARSIRLGTQTCWLLAAAAGDSKRPKPIMDFRERCERAALKGKWTPPFRCLSPMLDEPMGFDERGVATKIRGDDEASIVVDALDADYTADGLDTAEGSPSKMAGVPSSRDATVPAGDLPDASSSEPRTALGRIAAGLSKIRIRGDSAGGDESDLDPVSAAAMASQRVDTFASTLRLAEDLCGLSAKLSTVFPPEGRQGQLRTGIESVSDGLVQGHAPGAGVMFPMGDDHARVVRIPAEEAVLLNSREKAPYLLCLEVISPEGASSSGGTPSGWSRGSGDSSPLHDMATPAWSTLAGPTKESIERAAAEHETHATAAASPVPPLHPGLNGFAGAAAAGARRDRRAQSYTNLEQHSSIDEEHVASHVDGRTRRRGSADMGRPPLSPTTSSPADFPVGSSTTTHGTIFTGSAASVKPQHHRTKSFEIISNKVDKALAQVWRGDEPVVRVSLAVTPGRSRGHHRSGGSWGRAHSNGTDGNEGSGLGRTSWFGIGTIRDEGGSPDDSPGSDRPVRVTLFVENPAKSRVRSPPHQRTPSDVGLTEMASMMNRQTSWASPADARDATSPPNSAGSSPLRPRLGEENSGGAAPQSRVPSPWKRSAGGLGENWVDKVERVRASSPYGDLPGWSLKPVIIKAGDNCRQELLAIQMTKTFAKIYADAGLPLWLRPFDVIATSTTSAFIEAVTDAPSIHAVKSRAPRDTSLRQHFEAKFGKGGSPGFRTAQRNFVESLAGYSILTYIMQVKDRHNGNILLHDDGHLIHIDFNFMLSTSPGGINFESSPFKLTREYLEVMDSDDTGIASEAFNYYKVLCIQGYLAVRKHAERIIMLVEMMSASGCPCFKAGPRVLNNLRKRFNLGATEEQCVEIMLSMISDSMDAWCTRQYDFYQRVLNGIL